MSAAELERTVQARVVARYRKAGWLVVKLMLTSAPGIPDLLCLKDGRALFVEVKRPGGRTSPLQEYRIAQLRGLGFEVQVVTG